MAEYIERGEIEWPYMTMTLWGLNHETCHAYNEGVKAAADAVASIPSADVVPVVHGYHEGDVCIYGFGHENKSRAIVEIVKVLNDKRGVAEVKFHKVFVDDTGNGYFNYLLKSGNTMNASFQYLKNITPRMDGE